MQPFEFDKDYLATRHEQLQEQYIMRAMSWACLVVSLILLGGAGLAAALENTTIATVMFIAGLLFAMGTVFLFAMHIAMRSADLAVREEHERLLMLYHQLVEKPKRGDDSPHHRSPNDGAEDGELSEVEALAAQLARRSTD